MFNRRPRSERNSRRAQAVAVSHWATVGMRLMFRAELMPGRDRTARTFEVARLLALGRVELNGLTGQHAVTESEATH